MKAIDIMKLTAVAAGVVIAAFDMSAAECKFPVEGQMLVGVNYWGSKAGVHMWRADQWDEAAKTLGDLVLP